MLKLSQDQLNLIAEHGERDYPYECCGLLVGRFEQSDAKIIFEVFPISNASEEDTKRNRFLIRPNELLRGEQYAAMKQLDIIGFYHSHPDHPAVPSGFDLEHALPVYSYVIVSVRARQARDIRSWQMQPDRSHFNEEEIVKGN